jgi:glycerophosphoryl diester phosphodiesterase
VNLHRGGCAQRGGRALVIGHRGAPAQAAPNSLAGIAAAAAAGADLVELDLVEGEQGAGLQLGHPGERPDGPPASLEQALDALGGLPVGALLDLKRPDLAVRAAAAVRARGLEGRVGICSAWAGPLRLLGREAAAIERVAGYPRDRLGAAALPWPGPLTRGSAAVLRAVMPLRARLLLAATGAGALSLHRALVSPAVLAATHARGAALLAWTVNDPDEVARLARAGVDAIVTDDPRMAREVLATLGGQ